MGQQDRRPEARDSHGGDARCHPRIDANYPVELRVSLHGFEKGRRRFDSRGVTVNISRSGLLARFPEPVAAGSRCLVHFPGAEGRVGRTLIYASVCRVAESGGGYLVAVEFDNPLELLPPAVATDAAVSTGGED